jgi:NADPH2:quinone reductase
MACDAPAEEPITPAHRRISFGPSSTTRYGEVDVVLDPVGGALSEVALRATGWGGRFLVVGFASGGATPKGAIPQLPLNLALLNERRVLGVFWGAWKARPGGAEANRRNVERMLALIERGALRPPRGRVYRFAEWRAAFDDLMQHRAVGKVCIDLGTAARL